MSDAGVTASWSVLLLIGGAGAALLLRRSWGDRTGSRPWWIVAGWAAIAALLIGGGLALGGGRGPFMALTFVSVAGLILVGAGVELRKARVRGDRSQAAEPSDRVSKVWRGWLRGLLAGPLGMVAAMGTAICFVAFCPGAPQTRLVLGGLLAPVLWGGAMAWTLSDDRILRATAVLTGVSLVTFATAVMRGF